MSRASELAEAIDLLPGETLVPVWWVRAKMGAPQEPEPINDDEALVAAWVEEGTKNIRTPGRLSFGASRSETRA